MAASEADLDADTVLGWFAGRLASYKHPRRVVFVASLPRNAMGKVMKIAVVELLTQTE